MVSVDAFHSASSLRHGEVPSTVSKGSNPFIYHPVAHAEVEDSNPKPPEPDEFHKLLATVAPESAHSTHKLGTEHLPDHGSGEFDLLKFLNDDDEPHSGWADSGRLTPPPEILELIEDEDNDRELLEFQNRFFKWTFRQGNHIGARYDEGEFDLDMYGEPIYQGPQQTAKKPSPAYDSWWTNYAVTALNRPETKSGSKEQEQKCTSITTDPLVRFLAALLRDGFVDTFRNIFHIIHVNQEEYLRLHRLNEVTREHLYIKKEPNLMARLAEDFAQIERFRQSGLIDAAFTTCHDKIVEYHQLENSDPVVADTLKFYLNKLAVLCTADGGRGQAVASSILAELWMKGGCEVKAFKLYADVFFLSHNKSWTLTNEKTLAQHAADNLFHLYIRWGQTQEFPVHAEAYYSRARTMADYVHRNDYRAIAICCSIEAQYFLEKLEPEHAKTELADLRHMAREEDLFSPEVRSLFAWAEALVALRQEKFDRALKMMNTSVSGFEKLDNACQLHKLYRELGLLAEMQNSVHVAFQHFKSAWQTWKRVPLLPDIEDETLEIMEHTTAKPSRSGIDFITYMKNVYHPFSDPDRRKRALEVCQLYLEMTKPTRREVDSEGYGHVNMHVPLVSIDHEIHTPASCTSDLR